MSKLYTEAAPTQKVTFDEDEALTLAERTFSTEINEQLASDIIQYASRLHSRYLVNQQPTPDVAALVEALDRVIKAAPISGPLWHGSEQIVEARAALAANRKQWGAV